MKRGSACLLLFLYCGIARGDWSEIGNRDEQLKILSLLHAQGESNLARIETLKGNATMEVSQLIPPMRVKVDGALMPAMISNSPSK